MTENISCMRCKQKISYRRGCCVSCVGWCYRQVKSGRTTWEQLITEGVVLPVKSNAEWGYRNPLPSHRITGQESRPVSSKIETRV